MMSKKIQNLIAKYFTRQVSLSELDLLSRWIENPSNKEKFVKYVKINYAINVNMKRFGTDNSKKRLLKFIEQERKDRIKRKTLNYVKYAAVILVFVASGYILENGILDNKSEELKKNIEAPLTIDNVIEVGTDKAILTLEDGSNIDLEKGKTIRTNRIQSNGKELIYDTSQSENAEVAYNFLTIPRGGQFHIKLSDGTLVWLNSESRMKYPVAFKEGETREVELVYGEAYFEVSPSSLHDGATFEVLNTSQVIEVLGTEFNLKAYRDETNVYTTLVEGEVVINTSTNKKVLAPNQQSTLDINNNSIIVKPVNINDEISWRRGLFSFKGKSLEEIAKVLSRWYDVDILFSRPELKAVKFNGVLRKDETIEEILNNILTTNYIKAYEIKEKRIMLK
ncbi:FecR family protein [Arenibacter aquaticus]|uniref:FecR family protein n=1 Tax=Arenibacter aquaticus TaxID=2489054 RepID=A0A3S0BXT1_9FLAO|nr:FecR domain-containing protein [Arenibacter aquaticus]RTE54109.1 FecR family protein [Arenibacter aquaticus]